MSFDDVELDEVIPFHPTEYQEELDLLAEVSTDLSSVVRSLALDGKIDGDVVLDFAAAIRAYRAESR